LRRWAKARNGWGARLSPTNGTELGLSSPDMTEKVNFCRMLETIKNTDVFAKGSPGHRRFPITNNS